jgi:hypothetical protein
MMGKNITSESLWSVIANGRRRWGAVVPAFVGNMDLSGSKEFGESPVVL